MRLRPIAAVSVAALSALLLAGCAGSGSPEASPTGTAADLCASAAASGAQSEAVTVDGDQGTESTATFTAPLDVTAIQRTVLTEGADELTAGQWVNYAYNVFDAESGKELAAVGYTEPQLPTQISPDSGGQLFGCSGPGSRIVATAPATETTPAVVYVLDVLSIAPTAAWGAPQAPVAGFPTVTLAEDGQPSVEIPDADAPTSTQIAVLKKGDGAVVGTGDTTLLQYYGVDWATGDSFDSSWKKGTPYFLQGNTYVPGFVKALEGQTVGSQVLVVIPPADAYGEKSDSNTSQLAGESLVFVIDILGTQHAAAAQ